MSHRLPLALGFLVLLSSILSSDQSTLPSSWTYSSFLGGVRSDSITALTRDGDGNVYVAGTSNSPTFPTTPGTLEPTYPGPYGYSAVFVSKFSSSGSLIWSTFVGGGCYIYIVPTSIQVDSSQNVYIAGANDCNTFPTTPGLPNWGNLFLGKLNSSGSQLLFGTKLGGWSGDLGTPSVAVDSNGDAFVTGSGGTCCNAAANGNIGTEGGISDFWIAEVNSAGTYLKWSVTIGGSGLETSSSIAIESNMLYVTGYSDSLDFPVTAGALNQPGGSTFVVKLDPSRAPSSSMIYGALVGSPTGTSSNTFIEPFSIALDAAGDTYVSTWTYNTGMYTSPAAFQPASGTPPDGYVFELNPSASAIINGTYLGGGSADYAAALSTDSSGNTYVSGFTDSWDFPFTAYGNPGQAYNNDLAFYVKLNPQFAAVSSVVFGPNGTDSRNSIADLAGGAWFSGYTQAGFLTTLNAYQPQAAGSYDGYLLHTNFAGLCETSTVAVCAIVPDSYSTQRLEFTAQAADVEGAKSIVLYLDGLVAFSSRAAQFDVWLPVALGNHTATVVSQSADGSTQRAQQAFWVASSSTCPLSPVVPSLTFCGPLNAAVVSGSVNVVMQANDGSVPPATVNLYADGKLAATLQNQNGSYTGTLTLPSGPHTLSAYGKDSSNDVLRTSVVLQVE
jgi:hypothetical protein